MKGVNGGVAVVCDRCGQPRRGPDSRAVYSVTIAESRAAAVADGWTDHNGTLLCPNCHPEPTPPDGAA